MSQLTNKYIDLHIEHGDLVLDAGHNPTYLTDREVIAQDIVHAILDTGLAHFLIGERNTGRIADVQTQMVLLVEDDLRIMPGTVRVEQLNPPSNGKQSESNWWVFADTLDFGPIESRLITGANA